MLSEKRDKLNKPDRYLIKFQIPSTRFQTNPKFQTPKLSYKPNRPNRLNKLNKPKRLNRADPVRDKQCDIMDYTYVLQSMNDGEFYTGYTNDLRKRFN